MNWFLWWKCLDCLGDWNRFFGVQNVDTVSRCTTSYLLAWQGQRVLWCLVGIFRSEVPFICATKRNLVLTQKHWSSFHLCHKKKSCPYTKALKFLSFVPQKEILSLQKSNQVPFICATKKKFSPLHKSQRPTFRKSTHGDFPFKSQQR